MGWTSLCFCCSHLTAGQSVYLERNAELKDISKRLVLQPDKGNVLCHDCIFWFGDLDYRIGGLSNEVVKALIARGAWTDLQRADKLSVQRADDKVRQPTLQTCFERNVGHTTTRTGEGSRVNEVRCRPRSRH